MPSDCNECELGPCSGKDQKCLEAELTNLAQGKTTDWYRRGKAVSLEQAAQVGFLNKQAIDDDVIQENLQHDKPQNKRPPCQRRKGSSHS